MRVLVLAVVMTIAALSSIRAFQSFARVEVGAAIRYKSIFVPCSINKNWSHKLPPRGGWVRKNPVLRVVSTSLTTAETGTTTTTSTTTAINPFLQQEDLPKFALIKPNYLTPAIDTLLDELKTKFAALEQKLSSNETVVVEYEEVLPEVERIQFPINYAWGIAGHLNGVQNSPELRNEYEINQPKIVQVLSHISQSAPLYNALKVVQEKLLQENDEHNGDSTTTSSLDFVTSQKRRAVEQSIRAMTLGGVGLEGPAKERFNEIRMKLASLSTSFANNVLDATKAFSLTICDSSKMEGVPESAKSLWASAHVAHLKSTATPKEEQDDNGNTRNNNNDIPDMNAEKGPWRITLDFPSYVAVMSHMKDRAIREQVYMAHIQRASESSTTDDKNNIPFIYETLQLRQEMANMLGFSNYAELSLASKMAPSVAAVTELTNLMAQKALPAAQLELKELTELAKQEGGVDYQDIKVLAPWDVTFWRERLKERKFNMTEEETRPYFALPAVLDGLFALVQRLFNIQVIAATATADADGAAAVQVWNEDVQFFKVMDIASGKHIASFFLDPYSRPANKQGGAWMDVCIGKSDAVQRDVAVAYLTCNGSPPVGNKPSLMTFHEVETLFHEFGHGLQHMLTDATVGDVAGINGIEWDAVELPSQFMENWCYDKATIYSFAKHWETGERMPLEMFETLRNQKTFGTGLMTCRQLYLGQLDMELHYNYSAATGKDGGESIFDVQRRIAARYTPYNMPLPEDRFLCGFTHIFAGGYSAGYYSYLWAEVMSSDAFATFEEQINDDDENGEQEQKIQALGRLFRQTVLSLGGGVSPLEVFQQFVGREPQPDALLRHKGLLA